MARIHTLCGVRSRGETGVIFSDHFGCFALVVVVFGTPASLAAQPSYFCVEELKTGFSIDSSGYGWEQSNFHANGKFLVRPAEPGDRIYETEELGNGYHVFEIGEEWPTSYCEGGFSFWDNGKLVASPWLHCRGFITFRMNSETLRFVETYPFGFADSKKGEKQKHGNTPSIAIGSCSPL